MVWSENRSLSTLVIRSVPSSARPPTWVTVVTPSTVLMSYSSMAPENAAVSISASPGLERISRTIFTLPGSMVPAMMSAWSSVRVVTVLTSAPAR